MNPNSVIYRLSQAIDAEDRLIRRCERFDSALDSKVPIVFSDSLFVVPSGVQLEWNRILEEVDDE